jgi:coenzyme Q-binding protein COQ10
VHHHVSRVLPYTPDQLFRLVGEVERYPEFVPWVTSMRTWNRREMSAGVDCVDAEAGVGFAFLTERFATRVHRDAVRHQIDVNLLSGPFRRLTNRWRFIPSDAGTRVEFDIDFQFKSRLLEMMLAANFHAAVEKLMSCFEARAKALYGGAAAAG